jgi:hypothetical protein
LRNLFDQYSQPENRLTHALASALNEDPRLLRSFVQWITGTRPPSSLKIVEQRLPGELELTEDEHEDRGLPDCWIHDDDTWSLLIESKVAATLSIGQLRRHHSTARRRGFDDVRLLAIDVLPPNSALPPYVIFKAWREIYSWLHSRSSKSEWAGRAARYIEVCERKLPIDGYLKEGTLTEFAGIAFDEDNPYSYGEAKRLLRLVMRELRAHPRLQSVIDPDALGRGAITGKGQTVVWDFLRIEGLGDEKHTRYPHFTVVINSEEARAFLNVPNSMEARYRRPVKALGNDRFFNVMAEVNRNLLRIADRSEGSYPFANMKQRRYPTQRSRAILDGSLAFDLRTAFPGGDSQKVKVQPQWMEAMYSLIVDKRSNMEWAVGMAFPYRKCAVTKDKKLIDEMVASMLACEPLLDVLFSEGNW